MTDEEASAFFESTNESEEKMTNYQSGLGVTLKRIFMVRLFGQLMSIFDGAHFASPFNQKNWWLTVGTVGLRKLS